jgi:hypothetical protein
MTQVRNMSINSFRYSARCLAGGALGATPLHHVHALGSGDRHGLASQEAAFRRQMQAVWQVAPDLPGQISADSFEAPAWYPAANAFDVAPLHPAQAQGDGDPAGDAVANATHRPASQDADLPAAKLRPSRSLLRSAVDTIVNCLRRPLRQGATEY